MLWKAGDEGSFKCDFSEIRTSVQMPSELSLFLTSASFYRLASSPKNSAFSTQGLWWFSRFLAYHPWRKGSTFCSSSKYPRERCGLAGVQCPCLEPALWSARYGCGQRWKFLMDHIIKHDHIWEMEKIGSKEGDGVWTSPLRQSCEWESKYSLF